MSSGDNTGERNPFAPPPEDAPDQPWRPRTPRPPVQEGDEDTGEAGGDDRPAVPPPHPWSPGYRGGWSTPPQAPPPPRYDPTDPVQRHARYALNAGLLALFCTLLGVLYVALLLGALAAYWGAGALRGHRAGNGPAQPGLAEGAAPAVRPTALGAAPIGGALAARPHAPAALAGLFTGVVAVLFTLSLFGLQLAYQPYVTCVNDALTAEASQSCSDLAPPLIVKLTNPSAG
ncbi:hypothetical protein ACFQMG_17370 [Kitasatospora paranensis]|uniref:Integral membrane protein n=1 Tax=Kitasatospora paranensis TaxID=258053 RepID=A0ABW2G290_9ACTN